MIKNYKWDIIFLIFITIVFETLFALFSKYYISLKSIFIDVGREAYFPELILNGKLLYKDLFNIFGPLAYQVNAVLYKIFGCKMSTLGIAGNFCSVCILYFTYFISKLFLGKNISFFITLFVLVACVFSPSLFNFIYPYSYSLLYAYTSFMGAVLFFLLAFEIKNKQGNYDLFLFLSFFFAGISLSAKIEYSPFILLLVIFNVFVLKQSLLKMILNFAGFLLCPIMTYGYLLYQGVTVDDFINNFIYLKKYVSSKSLHYFYAHNTGAIFSLDLFLKQIKLLPLVTGYAFVVVYCLSYYVAACSTKLQNFNTKYLVIILGLLLATLIDYQQLFLFIPYIIYGILIYKIVTCIICKDFCIKSDVFFALILITIISVLKTAFLLNIKMYGSFALALPIIIIFVFVKNNLLKSNLNFSQKDTDILLSSLLVILTLACVPATYNYISGKTSSINTEKVVFYTSFYTAKPIRETFEYISNIPKNKSILVLPEGVFINYATDRDSKLYNYQSLMPPYIDTFGVDNIINDIKNTKIDYILFVPRASDEYGGGLAMCKFDVYGDVSATNRDEEKKLCKFIDNNYSLVKAIDKILFFKLKKIKQINI